MSIVSSDRCRWCGKEIKVRRLFGYPCCNNCGVIFRDGGTDIVRNREGGWTSMPEGTMLVLDKFSKEVLS